MSAAPRRFALWPALLVLLLTGPIVYIADAVLRQRATGAAEAKTERLAEALAGRLAADLDGFATQLQLLSRSQALQQPVDTARARAELDWLQRRSTDIAWIGLLDLQGRVLASTAGMLEGMTLPEQPMLTEGRRALSVGDTHTGGTLEALLPAQPGSVREFVDISMPRRDDAGRVVGVLAAHVDWRWADRLRQRLSETAGGPELMVFGAGGDTRLTPRRDDLPAELRRRRTPGLALVTAEGGGQWLVAAADVTAEPAAVLRWQVLALQPLDRLAAPLDHARLALAGGGVGLAVLLGTLSLVRGRRKNGPYAGLIAAALHDVDTDPDIVHDTTPPADVAISRLSAYQTRVTRLLQRWPNGLQDAGDPALPTSPDAAFARLAHDADRLRTVLDRLPVGIVITSGDMTVLHWNRSSTELLGYAAAEAVGRSIYDVLVSPEDREVARRNEQRLRDGELGESSLQAELNHQDGSRVWCEIRGVALRDDAGRLIGYVKLLRDLTDERRHAARARDTEQRLAMLVEAAVDLVLVRLDADGRVSQWSASAEVLFGVDAMSIRGRAIGGLFAFDDADSGVSAALIEGAREMGRIEHEGWLLRGGRERFWGNLLVYRIDDEADRPAGFALVARDLSERRATEERLQQSEAMLASIIDSASDAVISADVLGRIKLFNPAAERIFGVGAATIMGQPLDRLLAQRHRRSHPLHLARFATSNVTQQPMGRPGRVVGMRADGTELHLEAWISQSVVRSQKVLTAILRDVTDRVKAEHDSREHRLELSALTQRLMSTEQEGNRRLAQVLHDQLGQTIGAARLAFDALQSALPKGALDVTEVPRARLSRLIDRSVSEVRQVLVDLRPALLEDMGLSAAIDNEVQNQSQEAIDMLLVFEPDPSLVPRRWPPEVEFAVFMVAREALGNAIRHADASEVHVTLSHGASDLVLSVHDDGSGMADAMHRVKPGHLGMVGMRERVMAIGGHLHVDSTPETGTTITLRWSPPT